MPLYYIEREIVAFSYMVVEAENEAEAYDLADEDSDDEEVWVDVFNAGGTSLTVFEAREDDLEDYRKLLPS